MSCCSLIHGSLYEGHGKPCCCHSAGLRVLRCCTASVSQGSVNTLSNLQTNTIFTPHLTPSFASPTMAILAFVLVTIGACLAKHVYSTYKNYVIARLLGLPIIISPLDPYGIPCMISIRILTPIFKRLPFEIGTRWCRVANVTWAWESDGEMHTKLGANFVVVSPARNMLNTVDPETIKEVFSRKRDFLKTDIYCECLVGE